MSARSVKGDEGQKGAPSMGDEGRDQAVVRGKAVKL